MAFLLALAAFCWAGPARPVQLKLDVGPAAASVRPAAFQAIPSAVVSAIRAGDPQAFYKAALAHDYQPPNSDEVQLRLLREGAQRHEADGAIGQLLEQARVSSKRARTTKIDYSEFDRLVGLTPRLSLNPFQDVEPKRRILEAAGYTHLRGPGKARVPIALAHDIRVGRAFQNTHRTSQRRQDR
jgi:hypothetical protein